MRPRRWILIAIAILIPANAPSLNAWGAEGHHIVARLAWVLMTPATRERVSALLGGGFDAFVASSTWADEVRNDRPETYNWHFVNIHVSEGRYDAARHCVPGDRGDCIVAAIARLRATLADTAAPPAARSEALKFLVHFVGDLHQPLHTIDNYDRGGNDVRVAALRGENGRNTTLHGAWDTGLMNLSGETEPTRAARLLVDLANRPVALDLDVVRWVEGNHEIAKAIVYSYPGFSPAGPPADPVVLDTRYRTHAAAVIDRQLQTGGARLAALLDSLLGGRSAQQPSGGL